MMSPPGWLKRLADKVCQCVTPISGECAHGCHFLFYDGVWEVTLFPLPTEIIGGPQDGQSFTPVQSIDVQLLTSLFGDVQNCHWQTRQFGDDDNLGPHLGVLGIYLGRRVWLRLLEQAPKSMPEQTHPV